MVRGSLALVPEHPERTGKRNAGNACGMDFDIAYQVS